MRKLFISLYTKCSIFSCYWARILYKICSRYCFITYQWKLELCKGPCPYLLIVSSEWRDLTILQHWMGTRISCQKESWTLQAVLFRLHIWGQYFILDLLNKSIYKPRRTRKNANDENMIVVADSLELLCIMWRRWTNCSLSVTGSHLTVNCNKKWGRGSQRGGGHRPVSVGASPTHILTHVATL